MTTPAPAQMPLGQVPVGYLFTPDSGVTILKLTSKGLDGSLSGHLANDPAAPFTIPATAAETLSGLVHAMPDPETPAAPATLTPPPIVPGMVNTNIGQIAPAPVTTPGAAIQAAFPGAQQISPAPPPAYLAKRSAPLQEAVNLFDGWISWPEDQRTLGQRFQGAAYNLAEGPDNLATVRALLALYDAQRLARGFVPIFSPF